MVGGTGVAPACVGEATTKPPKAASPVKANGEASMVIVQFAKS